MEVIGVWMFLGLLACVYGQGQPGTTKLPSVIHHADGHEGDGTFTTIAAPTVLRVVTIRTEPYLTVTTKGDSNDTEFSGFIVDVLDEIFKDTDMTYDLYLVHDGKYGGRDRHTGKWNGMIGDVEKGKAHIAAAALSITPGRKRIVDFTEPWAAVNLTIVVQSDAPVKSLQCVLNSTTMSYGVISGSSTQNAFMTTPNDPYATMWAAMGSRSDELFVGSIDEGIEKVQNESDYGFITENHVAEYKVNRICGLKTVGSFLPQGGYGFAVSPDDDTGLKKVLDDALSKMKESGKMKELHRKYWETETCGAAHAQWMSAVMLCSLLATLMRLL